MTFPYDPTALHVEAAFGASLADDPEDLDFSSGELTPEYVKETVTITRGFEGDASQATPTRIEFGLRNPAGIFSPRNLTGPHYGELRRNTPIQVRVDTDGFGSSTRGFGYIPSWPVRWTGPDIDDRIETTAAGALQRLQLDDGAVSALRRSALAGSPVFYVPMEDGEDATAFEVIGTGSIGVTEGSVVFADRTDLGGASTAPDLSAAGLTALPTGLSSTSWHAGFLYYGFASNAAGAICFRLITNGTTYNTWRISFPGAVGGNISVFVSDDAGGLTGLTGPVVDAAYGLSWHYLALTAEQSGGNMVFRLYIDGVLPGAGSSTVAGTLGAPIKALFNQNLSVPGGGHINSFAHFLVGSGVTPTALADAVDGYAGELAGVRFARLCEEADEHYEIYAPNGTGSTEPMGIQQPATLPALLRQCAETEEGLFLDDRYGRLLLITRDHLYTAVVGSPAMTLDYEGEVSWLEPDDDDRDTLNIATVTRIGGSAATSEVEDGPLGSDRDTGVGPYPARGISRSLELDSQAANHAGWLTHMGTVDEQRQHILIDLFANPQLVETWIETDVGSLVRITSPPQAHTGPEALDLLLVGYREVIDATAWYVEMWLLPIRGYAVLEIETGVENASRVSADSVLAVGYDDNDVTLSVTSVSAEARWIDSTNFASQFPILIKVAGERMLCTAIAGTGATQTFTVTRGYDGVTKALPSGSEVQVDKPAVIPL